jgi:hypothetical protein
MAEDPGGTRARFEELFEIIAAAMTAAAKEADHSIAASEVERFGFTKTAPTKPLGEAWQTTEKWPHPLVSMAVLRPVEDLLVQKDMNIMSLELREGGNVTCVEGHPVGTGFWTARVASRCHVELPYSNASISITRGTRPPDCK